MLLPLCVITVVIDSPDEQGCMRGVCVFFQVQLQNVAITLCILLLLYVMLLPPCVNDVAIMCE